MVFIKVTNGLETRRLQVTLGELTFEQLKERLSSSFPGEVSADKPLSLQYRDSEGDVITISSDAELQGALVDLAQESTLKLQIQTKPAARQRNAQRRHVRHGRSIFDLLFDPSSPSVWDNFDKQFSHTESLLQQLWGRECCKDSTETSQSKESSEPPVTSEASAEEAGTTTTETHTQVPGNQGSSTPGSDLGPF